MTDTASASAGDQADPKEEFVLTKEILAFENRRNDLIVAAGVLLFTFFLGSYKETYPDIPLHLATGRIIADSGIPKHDSFSFGAPADKVWINPSWLFDWGLFRAYSAVGDVAVAVVKALAGAAAIGLLIGIRHRGPTLWWTVFCAFFAAVALSPRLFLGSEVVAALLLALLLLCIFQARYAGRFWMIYLAAPITALWANVDLSFFVAPLVLAAFLLGEAIQSVCPKSWRFGESQWQASQLVSVGVVTVLCVLAGAATPFGMATLSFPYDWVVNIAPQAPYN
ncbi:MAG TPA: hypothetical protein VNC50_15755, partial [Planctomycetia bacterium]|nr:hypothetical protein [Planctomycetia bacterium]